MNLTSPSDTIVQEITIKSPAERNLFQALTNPAQRMKWWGAEGRSQVTHVELDLRPGGKWAMSGIAMGGRPFIVAGDITKSSAHVCWSSPGFPTGMRTRRKPLSSGIWKRKTASRRCV